MDQLPGCTKPSVPGKNRRSQTIFYQNPQDQSCTKKFCHRKRIKRVEQRQSMRIQASCMANFKDQFLFFMDRTTILRYFLTHHIQEESLAIPGPTMDEYDRACSLGDKVYVLMQDGGDEYRFSRIYVLHNPDASISSQEMHWRVIEVP